jgi:hypothetical protein
MSNTRHAEPGKPFRQERFCSSPEFNVGLMANLVAKRTGALDRADDRELIWTLQSRSHQKGGLAKLVKEVVTKFPEEVATPSMRRFGFKPGQVYNQRQVRTVREEMLCEPEEFILAGELSDMELLHSSDDPTEQAHVQLLANRRPERYPAAAFVDKCQAAAQKLETYLAELCLNPACPIDSGPWYFPGLIDCLRRYESENAEARRSAFVLTEIGEKVWDILDFTLYDHGFSLIDGRHRIGKSVAVKAWCELHPGAARYVQVPTYSDDIGFFRAIAEALGVSVNLNSKAHQLRDRITEALKDGSVLLCLDEAQYLWPQSNYREALPQRLDWVMKDLVKRYGVPVCLVTTPQFMETQKRIVKRTSWTAGQFTGLVNYRPLPGVLSLPDLESVARALFPEGEEKSIATLVDYATTSSKYLGAIDQVVRLARYLAKKSGRQKATFADVKQAIKRGVMPSDSALAAALKKENRSMDLRSAGCLHEGFSTLAHDENTPAELEAIAGSSLAGNASPVSRGTAVRGELQAVS